MVCHFYCTPNITIRHHEDGHRSDQNMYVQRIKAKIYVAEQLHNCTFVGLCMNNKQIYIFT
jgi:hypothetical protein